MQKENPKKKKTVWLFHKTLDTAEAMVLQLFSTQYVYTFIHVDEQNQN